MSEKEKLQEKLDLLSALKEDEEQKQKTKKKPKEKKEEVIKEIQKVKKATPKRKKRIILTLVSFIALVASLTYLIYNIVKATDQVNQPYLIINSSCLLLLCILLVSTGFINNPKIQKKFHTLNVTVVALYLLFQALITSNVINIPTLTTLGDFSNTSINEVIKWANKNKITLDQTYEYSDSIESDHIISQNLPADTLVKEIKQLEVTVSNGPNYESIVSIPNMIGWNVDDVVKKIKELKLNHVTIEFEFNEAIEKDIEFEQNISGEMRRNEELILKFSLGLEANLEPVSLIDLINKEEFDAILWLKRNGIKYEISYEFDNKISKGHVISTTPEKDTLINQKEMTVSLVISKGPKITAPDLMKMSLEEITEWAIKNKLILMYDSEYNDQVKAGGIIRVSVSKGDILEENGRISVITSKGPLKMIQIEDGDITALRNFVTEHQLVLTENSEFSDTVPKGNFISLSKKTGDTVNSGEEIKVIISLGKSTQIPNFIGMNATKAKTTCDSLGLTCKMSYVYSSKTKGIVFNQSMSAGSNVIANTEIVLTISNGVKPANSSGNSSNNTSKPNNNSNQPSNNNSGSSNNSSNNNSPNTPPIEEPPTPTCISYTLRLNGGENVEQAKSIIRNLNPNGKFNFVSVNPGYGTSGSLRSDMLALQGTKHTSCETVTIYIIDTSI